MNTRIILFIALTLAVMTEARVSSMPFISDDLNSVEWVSSKKLSSNVAQDSLLFSLISACH